MFSIFIYRQGELRNYFIVYWLYLAFLLLLQTYVPQDELFLFINRFTTSWLDYPMNIITFIGSGWFFGLVMGITFYKSREKGLLLLAVYVLTTLIAQGIKHLYPEIPRPQLFFETIHQTIRIPNGVEVLKLASFPSGHSTSIFALCTSLAFLFQSKKLHLIFLAIAIVVALSRVYVAAHFFKDITAGMFIGAECAALCILIYKTIQRRGLEQKP
jgi:membrane-associated phospholipid phosphatase